MSQGRTVIAGNTEIARPVRDASRSCGGCRRRQRITGLDDRQTRRRIENRHLNNWETTRLYAGNAASGTGGLNGENGSIFNFAATGTSAGRNLPVILDRYIVVARALASLGINGFEINLVNADNAYLTPARIAQEAALADALRPYGIRISLAINYTAPTDPRFAPDTLSERAGLDPYGDAFRGWWNRKARELTGLDPGLHGLHGEGFGQLRGPAGPAGLSATTTGTAPTAFAAAASHRWA